MLRVAHFFVLKNPVSISKEHLRYFYRFFPSPHPLARKGFNISIKALCSLDFINKVWIPIELESLVNYIDHAMMRDHLAVFCKVERMNRGGSMDDLGQWTKLVCQELLFCTSIGIYAPENTNTCFPIFQFVMKIILCFRQSRRSGVKW